MENIFESVVFLNEGKQAREYKAKRRAEEREQVKKDLKDMYGQRQQTADLNCVGSRMNKLNPQFDVHKIDGKKVYSHDTIEGEWTDVRRHNAALDMAKRAVESDKPKNLKEFIHKQAELARAEDAANRHIRRHPEKYPKNLNVNNESTIFESLQMI